MADQGVLASEDGLIPAVPPDATAGVGRLLKRLENALTPELSVRRGASMADFFSSRRYTRRMGERMSEYAVRFDDVQTVVLDEADHMMDMGFLPQIKKVLQQLHDAPTAR